MKKNLINLFLGLSLTTTSLINAMERDELNSASHPEAARYETATHEKWSSLDLLPPLPPEIAEMIIPPLDWFTCFNVSQTCKAFLPLLYQFSGHIPFKVLQKPEMIDHLPKFTNFKTLPPLYEQVFAVVCWWNEVKKEFKRSNLRWEDLGYFVKNEFHLNTFHDAKYEDNAWKWEVKYTQKTEKFNEEILSYFTIPSYSPTESFSITGSFSIKVKDTIFSSIKESFSSYIKMLLEGPSSNPWGHPPCDGSEANCALKNKNPNIIFSCYCTTQVNCQQITQKLKPVMKKLKKFLYSAYLLEIHSKKKENLPDEKFEDFLKSCDFSESDIEKFIKDDF